MLGWEALRVVDAVVNSVEHTHTQCAAVDVQKFALLKYCLSSLAFAFVDVLFCFHIVLSLWLRHSEVNEAV